jgi:molecular chaperone DnaK (HSP70)
VIRLLPEPTAAAVAYFGSHPQGKVDGSVNKQLKVLVADFGGGTFDVSALYVTTRCLKS